MAARWFDRGATTLDAGALLLCQTTLKVAL